MALETLHEVKPQGLNVSCAKTKVQAFGGLLDGIIRSIHAFGKDIEILESFTYYSNAFYNTDGCCQKVL